MANIRVAINGFGRIGRAFFRVAHNKSDLEVVAVNDLAPVDNLAYLLKYDTVYGRGKFSVKAQNDSALVVDGYEIPFFGEKDPADLPWKKLDVDVVLEATGVFASYEKAKVHLDAGAKRVVISAPVKDEPPEGIAGATVLMGVNDDKLKTCDISSNASCTTNAGSPLMTILDEKIGVEKALLNTVHGYTATQRLVDAPHKDPRRGRAAAQNIVPSSTGAAVAVTKALTQLTGKFDGIAVRVPVVAGSIADITFIAKRDTSVEEINEVLRTAVAEERWQGIFSTTDEPIVSSDIVGEPFASIADLSFTRVVGGNLVKVLAWYDNEMGYTHSLVEHVVRSGVHVKN